MTRRVPLSAFLALVSLMSMCQRLPAEEPLRIGIVGCDTSHAPTFAAAFNAPQPPSDLTGMRLVAAYPVGSDDIPSSKDRLAGFTQQLKDQGVAIVDSMDQLLEKADVVLLASVDGRKHLEQARPVIAAGKPVFIDKPVAGTLADAVKIYRLAAEKKVPCFSSSSLRYSPEIVALAHDAKVGDILGSDVYAPCPLEPHHRDLFWYGIHGVEALFTLMGPGCQTVSRTHTDGADVVVGVWQGGRIGTFRGLRGGANGYGATIFGSTGIVANRPNSSLDPMIHEIAKFFRTRQVPVSAAETEEILAFMEAADESAQHKAKPIVLGDVLERARQTEK